MLNKIAEFLRDEEGAGAVEYGLIVGLIAVVIIAGMVFLSDGLGDLFEGIGDKLTSTGTTVNP